jgi:hypothetical protein
VQVAQDAELAEAARAAFLLYGKGRHPAALNLGDCASYAVAKLYNLPLGTAPAATLRGRLTPPLSPAVLYYNNQPSGVPIMLTDMAEHPLSWWCIGLALVLLAAGAWVDLSASKLLDKYAPYSRATSSRSLFIAGSVMVLVSYATY